MHIFKSFLLYFLLFFLFNTTTFVVTFQTQRRVNMNEKIIEQQKLHFSGHALKRMNQRNLSANKANLIFWFGTEVSDSEIYFTKKNALDLLNCISTKTACTLDIEQPILWLERQIGCQTRRRNNASTAINKLIGWKIVVDGRKVITCYRCTQRKQQKRLSKILH